MKWFRILLLTTAALCTTACKESFLDAPTSISVSDSSRAGAPDGLTATNGKSACIELDWQTVRGASRYYIYGTTEPTPKESDFKQITQTEENSISIKVAPGTTAWYKVAAVDSTYNVGKLSPAVRGSSLARPEITQLESDESSDEINVGVYWFMANCNDETYRSITTYEIKYTDGSNISESIYIKASDLEENYCLLENLNPHTKYNYQVIARNDIYGDQEESLTLTEETLHRLRPTAPIDLRAGRGNETNGITLTFTLPEKADVRYVDGTYQNIPLYFKIYRREAGSDSGWTEKASHFGPSADSYVQGEEVSWTDDSIPATDRGIKYEYKVQSFIDKTYLSRIKEIYHDNSDANYTYIETSDAKSYATDEGWAMAIPVLSVKKYTADVNPEDSSQYISANAELSFIWKNFLSESEDENNALASKYHYHLYKKWTKFSVDGGTESTDHVKTFNSISEINSDVRHFSLPSERGNYIFTLYISESTSPSESGVETAVMQQSLVVTDNAESIEGLSVIGGYKNKFKITWKNNTAYTYTLSYTQKYNGIDEGHTYPVDLNSAATSGGNLTLTDTSNMDGRQDYGVSRTYTLTAEKPGIAPISQTYEAVESLGTPQLVFDATTPSYDTISISWKKVSGAEDYAIKIDGPSEPTTIKIPDAENTDDANVTESTVSGETFYTYTFSPEELGAGYYADAKKSGTERTIKVTASSDKENTEGSGSAWTLGPAGLNLSAQIAKAEKSIDVSWKSIEGAGGYILQRYRYRMEGNSPIRDEDTAELFYIDASSLSVATNSGESISNSEMLVTKSEGTITLKDIFASIPASEKDTASQRQVTQSRIPWGIPIEYTVIPVLSSADKFADGKLTSTSIKDSSHYFIYNNANSDSIAKKGSAIGYGLNIRASKAESSTKIKIEWDAPYMESNSGVTPILYERIANRATDFTSTDKVTTGNTTISTRSTTIDLGNDPDEKKIKPYEFAVKYVKTGSDQTHPFVESFMEKLAEDKDDLSPTEQRNKGYTFYLPGLHATGLDANLNESFTETVSWDAWDYSERALGPEDDGENPAYTIWQKNLNNAAGWFQVGSMKQDGTVTELANAPSWYNTTITPNPYSLALTPTGLTDSTGYNQGLLKVQRDYKHYYMIQARRKVGEKTVYSYRGKESADSVYTYRKISGEELSKAAMLTIADLVNTHVTGHSTGTGTLGSGATEWQIGNSSSSPRFGWAQDSRSRFWWFIKDYTQTYTELPGGNYPAEPFKTFIKISDENAGSVFRGKRSTDHLIHLSGEPSAGLLGAPDFSIDTRIPLIVEPYGINGICTSYGGTVNFAVSKNDIAITLVRNGTTVFEKKITGDKENCLKWCPVDLDSRGYKGKDKDYGWWNIQTGDTPTEDFTEEEE